METRPHPYPVRCAACELLYYPNSLREYLCAVCQGSLEDYVASIGEEAPATLAWWRRQNELREEVRRSARASQVAVSARANAR